MAEEVSLIRLYVLRGMYLLNCVLLGAGVWVAFIRRQEPWDSVSGVAFCFWAALAGLSALGIRYPLAMLPLLFSEDDGYPWITAGCHYVSQLMSTAGMPSELMTYSGGHENKLRERLETSMFPALSRVLAAGE